MDFAFQIIELVKGMLVYIVQHLALQNNTKLGERFASKTVQGPGTETILSRILWPTHSLTFLTNLPNILVKWSIQNCFYFAMFPMIILDQGKLT